MVFIVFGFFIDKPQSISLLPSAGDLNIILSSSFATNLVWVLYAYTGWNSVIYISGELIDPKKNISKVMIYATILVTVLYVLLNYVFLYSTPIASCPHSLAHSFTLATTLLSFSFQSFSLANTETLITSSLIISPSVLL